MDRQTLTQTPSILELIVSYDWASPTLPECEAYGIKDRLTSRITFRVGGKQTWIIDGNILKTVTEGEVEEYMLTPVHKSKRG